MPRIGISARKHATVTQTNTLKKEEGRWMVARISLIDVRLTLGFVCDGFPGRIYGGEVRTCFRGAPLLTTFMYHTSIHL